MYLFLCDIDGCLMPSKKEKIPIYKLLDTLHLIRRSGSDLSLCTGRSQPYVEAISKVLDISLPCICENGAYIYNPLTNDVEININIKSYLTSIKQKIEDDVANNYLYKLEIGKYISLSLNPIHGNSIDTIYEYIKSIIGEDDNVTISYSSTAVDITPKDINKGNILESYITKIPYKYDQIIGIGDSFNDLPFLSKLSLTACPVNSSNEVKSIVDYISKYPNTLGVIDIVKHYLKAIE